MIKKIQKEQITYKKEQIIDKVKDSKMTKNWTKRRKEEISIDPAFMLTVQWGSEQQTS